jgi:hypothetical protein
LQISPLGLEQFESTEDFLQIRIDTSLLRGSRWRLSIQVVVPPESFGRTFRTEALSWIAQPPFISRSLLPSKPVIVGEDQIDGRTVEGRLVWRVAEGAVTAGEYRGRLMFVLEELP